MKTILVCLFLGVVSIAFSQVNDSESFTPWKKMYNTTTDGIDSGHYVYVRLQICTHTKKNGSPQHLSKYEVRYPDKLSDSTTLYGDIFFVGNVKQVVNGNSYTSRDTISTFFPVTQGEIFNEELSLDITELKEAYIKLLNVKVIDNFEKDPAWIKGMDRTKKIVGRDSINKDIKIRANAPEIGKRG